MVVAVVIVQLAQTPEDDTQKPQRCALKAEFVSLPEKALTQNATRRLQFYVHAVSWLHYMVLHKHSGVVLVHKVVDVH